MESPAFRQVNLLEPRERGDRFFAPWCERVQSPVLPAARLHNVLAGARSLPIGRFHSKETEKPSRAGEQGGNGLPCNLALRQIARLSRIYGLPPRKSFFQPLLQLAERASLGRIHTGERGEGLDCGVPVSRFEMAEKAPEEVLISGKHGFSAQAFAGRDSVSPNAAEYGRRHLPDWRTATKRQPPAPKGSSSFSGMAASTERRWKVGEATVAENMDFLTKTLSRRTPLTAVFKGKTTRNRPLDDSLLVRQSRPLLPAVLGPL